MRLRRLRRRLLAECVRVDGDLRAVADSKPSGSTTPSSPTSAVWPRATSSASPGSRSARSRRSRSTTTTIAVVEFSADPTVVLTEGTKAAIRWADPIGDRYLALQEGAGGLTQLNPGQTIPSRPDRARAGPRRPTRRLPAAVPRAGPRTGQRLDGSADPGVSGPGHHDQLVSEPDGGGDQHPRRPRRADRTGHHQPQHRARYAGRSERPGAQGSRLAVGTRQGPGRSARPTSATRWPTPTPRRRRSPICSRQARPPFKNTVAQIGSRRSIVVADHDYFDDLLNTLPDSYKALARLGMYGDFFSFYLCDCS